MFSQRWPITSCISWREKNLNNTCEVPNAEEWIVHGLWPTKTGTSGPYFCNTSIHFDPTDLAPIEADLEKYWTNVEANTKKFSFWKHEWNKHGTCAVQLPVLNSPLKYFTQGLTWMKQYNITGILESSKIVPNSDGYTLGDIYNAIKTVLKVNPDIQCTTDKAKFSLLSEIRICFDKNLELIDCVSSIEHSDNILGNCNANKAIMYYSNFTMLVADDFDAFVEPDFSTESSLLNVYNLIKFLIWFTL